MQEERKLDIPKECREPTVCRFLADRGRIFSANGATLSRLYREIFHRTIEARKQIDKCAEINPDCPFNPESSFNNKQLYEAAVRARKVEIK